jgi:ATP-binding cassette subfamily B protein
MDERQAGPEGDSTPTVFDYQPDPEARVDIRRLPSLVRQGLRLVWSAGRRDFILSTSLQAVGGVGIALLLVLGQRALGALLEANRGGGSVAEVLPWAAAVAVVATLQFFASTVQRERQEVLGELVKRHVEESVIDVAAAVELEAFETPSFHNRVQRVRMSSHYPLTLVFGISGLAGAVVGTIGVVAGLIAIQPLLIPMIVVVFVPAWLVASRRSEAFYRFFWRMTPRDRERQYIAGLLTEREAAKECAVSVSGAICVLGTSVSTPSESMSCGGSPTDSSSTRLQQMREPAWYSEARCCFLRG